MRISLDYDKTYTADPALWDRFIADATKSGHEVVCVTMRHAHEVFDIPARVICTGRRAKGDFVREMGMQIDVWIDDSPYWIMTDSL